MKWLQNLVRTLGWQVCGVILLVATWSVAQGPFNPSNVQYRILPSEKGVVTLSYPPGHAFRYGITCNRTTNYTTQAENVMIAAAIPGVTAYFPNASTTSASIRVRLLAMVSTSLTAQISSTSRMSSLAELRRLLHALSQAMSSLT